MCPEHRPFEMSLRSECKNTRGKRRFCRGVPNLADAAIIHPTSGAYKNPEFRVTTEAGVWPSNESHKNPKAPVLACVHFRFLPETISHYVNWSPLNRPPSLSAPVVAAKAGGATTVTAVYADDLRPIVHPFVAWFVPTRLIHSSFRCVTRCKAGKKPVPLRTACVSVCESLHLLLLRL